MNIYFSRIFKVKEGKLEKFKAWMTEVNSLRAQEAIATFEYEGIVREVFALFETKDGIHYVVAFNEAMEPPKPGDPEVPINQEHTAIRRECLEPVSKPGEVVMDLRAD